MTREKGRGSRVGRGGRWEGRGITCTTRREEEMEFTKSPRKGKFFRK